MVCKITDSLKKIPMHAYILLIIVLLYYINNFFLKQHTSGILNYIFVCHFNDYLGGIIFLTYTNTILYTSGKLIYKLRDIIVYCLCIGIFWEYIAPLLKSSSVTDWKDVLCYIFGGISYRLIMNKNIKRLI